MQIIRGRYVTNLDNWFNQWFNFVANLIHGRYEISNNSHNSVTLWGLGNSVDTWCNNWYPGNRNLKWHLQCLGNTKYIPQYMQDFVVLCFLVVIPYIHGFVWCIDPYHLRLFHWQCLWSRISNHLLPNHHFCPHYSDVIMGAMASQITNVPIVYSTACSVVKHVLMVC